MARARTTNFSIRVPNGSYTFWLGVRDTSGNYSPDPQSVAVTISGGVGGGAGGGMVVITDADSPYSVPAGIAIVIVGEATAANVTIDLPAAAGSSRPIAVKNRSAFETIITPAGSGRDRR